MGAYLNSGVVAIDDIIFFNGLGDAIARSYSVIRVDARIIMPEPTYSTHFMAEVAHASFPPNTYKMNPYNNWAPDLGELERKIKSAQSIVGILVINPDNPTGYVYSKEKLAEIVRIAREHNLFIVADEIYHNMIRAKNSIFIRSDWRCASYQHELPFKRSALAGGKMCMDRSI